MNKISRLTNWIEFLLIPSKTTWTRYADNPHYLPFQSVFHYYFREIITVSFYSSDSEVQNQILRERWSERKTWSMLTFLYNFKKAVYYTDFIISLPCSGILCFQVLWS